MSELTKQLLAAVVLPYFNFAMIFLIVVLLAMMVGTYLQMIRKGKKPDKYRTAEVFSALKSAGISVRKKSILTMREQPMFSQLVKALPNHVILAQVSFQALLDTDDKGTRNRFDRKYADFVICTKAFNAIAIVEFDDSTHDGREKRDADRDSFLITAGYPVFRYRSIPDLLKLRQDITPDAAIFNEPSPLANIETA